MFCFDSYQPFEKAHCLSFLSSFPLTLIVGHCLRLFIETNYWRIIWRLVTSPWTFCKTTIYRVMVGNHLSTRKRLVLHDIFEYFSVSRAKDCFARSIAEILTNERSAVIVEVFVTYGFPNTTFLVVVQNWPICDMLAYSRTEFDWNRKRYSEIPY